MNPTRRTFLSSAAALSAASVVTARTSDKAKPLGDQTIRVALIGCGGRGRGAASQALSTDGRVKLVAMADAFHDKVEDAYTTLKKRKPEDVDVPAERRFHGFDGYKQAIDCITDEGGVDLVILTTPPGFRPMHYEYAISKGMHVFMEKPVAVDGPGIRTVLAATEEAKRRGLKVGVGLQRHHSAKYQETIQRLHDGEIGDLVLMRSYWNSGGVWTRPRQSGQTEMEYQMRNWYYFNWLCGDHICEQHIHNLDVANWAKQMVPKSAQGMGGRQVRTGLEHGEIYDHHMVEYTYEDGSKLLSACRHQPGTWTQVTEFAHGTKGTAHIGGGRIQSDAGDWRFRGEDPDHYQVEHDVLFRAVREGHEHNEGENGAHSTLTSILGRMATYSGKMVTWDQALNSELALVPDAYSWDGIPPTLPDSDGRYPIPMPGQTKAF